MKNHIYFLKIGDNFKLYMKIHTQSTYGHNFEWISMKFHIKPTYGTFLNERYVVEEEQRVARCWVCDDEAE